MVQTYGPFQSVVSLEKGQEGGVVDVICAMHDGNVRVRIAFDDAHSISGLWIAPVQK